MVGCCELSLYANGLVMSMQVIFGEWILFCVELIVCSFLDLISKKVRMNAAVSTFLFWLYSSTCLQSRLIVLIS